MSEVKKSVWELVADELIKNGIKTYPPATKIKQCTEPYVVLKLGGAYRVKTYSTQREYYQILLYVPKNQYSKMADFEERVRRVLDNPPLFPMIMPSGQTENDFFDDNIDAHLRIIIYYNYKRNRHL